METITIIIIGMMMSCSMYLILQKSLVQMLFGFSLLTHAANLFLLVLSGSPIDKDGNMMIEPIVKDSSLSYVDPLPQALILTAIVIGFGVTTYLIVLLYKIFKENKTTNPEELYQ